MTIKIPNHKLILWLFMLASTANSTYLFGYTAYVDSLFTNPTINKEDTTKVLALLRSADSAFGSNIDLLESYSRQALMLSQKEHYLKGLAYSNYSLSRVYMAYDFDVSEHLLLTALEYAQEIQDSILISKVYNSLGALLVNNEEEKTGLAYYEKSLDLLQHFGEEKEMAALYNNIGTVFGELKDSTAISYFLKAAEMNKEFGHNLWLSINYINVGIVLFQQEQIQDGLHYLNLGLELSLQHNYVSNLPEIYTTLGEYYFNTEQFQNSIEYAELALQKSQEQLNRVSELKALEMLKNNYVSLNIPNKALAYAEQMSAVSDSIHLHGRLKELAVLELKYKFEDEMEQQLKEQELLKSEYKSRQIFLLSIILLTGLIIIILALLFAIQKERLQNKELTEKKLTQELEFKKKELTTQIIYAIQKDDVLNSLLKDLEEASKASPQQNINSSIAQLSKKIKASLAADLWEEFEIRFQQVYLDFYKNILIAFPNLTPNEKKLCAFLRLNMSSKEISKITGQSVSAIEMARVRLRKKLGISNKNIHLGTFLSQF